jgi:hypothetical protein
VKYKFTGVTTQEDTLMNKVEKRECKQVRMWMEEGDWRGWRNCPVTCSFHSDPQRGHWDSPAIRGGCSLWLSQPQLLLRLFQIFFSPAGRGH